MPPAEESGDGEYANARKLVLRAANREAILQLGGAVKKASKKDAAEDDDDNRKDQQQQVGADFSELALKPDHILRPCWVSVRGVHGHRGLEG